MGNTTALLLTSPFLNLSERELAELRTSFPQVNFKIAPREDYTESDLLEAEIIVGNLKPTDLAKAPSLRWLQTQSSGVNAYLNKALYCNDEIILTNAAGTYGKQIADHIIGLIVAFNHSFFTYHEQMHSRLWRRYYPTVDIYRSTLLILGLGDLGKNLAKRAKALEMNVIAIKRTLGEKPAFVDELYQLDALDNLLPRADFVTLCLPSTAETELLFDDRRLSLMKKGSYLFNPSRGSLIDEEALIKALESGHLGGASLDATTIEPLPSESKLWQLPNVLITPHSSGLSLNSTERLLELLKENLSHYFTNQTLMKNRVDFARQY